MEFIHQPVMLAEVMANLNPVTGGRYVDGTCGGGGHTAAILERVGTSGWVLGLDRDPKAMDFLKEKFAAVAPNLLLRQANFSDLDEVMSDLGWATVDGIVLDLGVSSYQLEGSGRGFSFSREETLDMRMDPGHGRSAAELVNTLPEKELADLIFQYGEERESRRVARAIVKTRATKPIETSGELARIVHRALVRPGRRSRLDLATRTFLALRLMVNQELEHLAKFLSLAPKLLKVGGRLVVISFHSLEDRLVKRSMSRPAEDPRLNREPTIIAVHKKPLRPSALEVQGNPRARSAKLRTGERI